MDRVIVGMSGGVDSAVTAYLLQLAGYDVIGVTLRSWIGGDGKESRCCEIDDARNICAKLNIPYYVHNCFEQFRDKVTDPFIKDYVSGLTPNPCIECNRYVKWDRMLDMADTMQAKYVATGHYASVVKLDNGRYTVKKAEHTGKDQTYMLYKLTQEQLGRTLMPLGKLTKEEVRNIAAKAELPVANKPDSQEICFVTEGNYAEYIEEHYSEELPGEGNFIDEEGRILGRHKGIIYYTVGQRKGLGLPLGYPAYVKSINTDTNEVVIGTEACLYKDKIICRDVNMLSLPCPDAGTEIKCRVKIRYHYVPQEALARVLDDNRMEIYFDTPVRAAAPGQSAVLYDDDDCVIGGGVIE